MRTLFAALVLTLAATAAHAQTTPPPATPPPNAVLTVSRPNPVTPGTFLTVDASASVGEYVFWDTDVDPGSFRIDTDQHHLDFAPQQTGPAVFRFFAFRVVDGKLLGSKADITIDAQAQAQAATPAATPAPAPAAAPAPAMFMAPAIRMSPAPAPAVTPAPAPAATPTPAPAASPAPAPAASPAPASHTTSDSIIRRTISTIVPATTTRQVTLAPASPRQVTVVRVLGR